MDIYSVQNKQTPIKLLPLTHLSVSQTWQTATHHKDSLLVWIYGSCTDCKLIHNHAVGLLWGCIKLTIKTPPVS